MGYLCDVKDDTSDAGKIALTADVPTRFSYVKVVASQEESERISGCIADKNREESGFNRTTLDRSCGKRCA